MGNIKYSGATLLLCLALLSCNEPINEKSQNIRDLKTILALGKVINLNQSTLSVEPGLFVKLHEVPVFVNDCFKEMHGICQYKYYVSVSSFDEYPETNVYKLSQKGVYRSVEWLDISETDKVSLSIDLDTYTKEALSNNSDLINKKIIINITLGLDSIKYQ